MRTSEDVSRAPLFFRTSTIAGLVGLFMAPACAASWPALDLDSLPSSDAYPDAEALILLDEQTLEFELAGGAVVLRETRRFRVRILAEGGHTHAGFGVGHDRTFSEVVRARSRVVRPDGSVREYARREMVDAPAISFVLYADQRVLSLELEPLPNGTVVEHEFHLLHRDPERFLHRFGFGWRQPIREARLRVLTPPGWELEHLASRYWRAFDWAPEVSSAPDGRRIHTWESLDLPAIKDEPHGPSLQDVRPQVALRLASWTVNGQPREAFRDMESYGRWVHELQSGTDEPSDEIRAVVAELLDGAPDDPRERARRLYTWVQEHIRYVAIEIGYGGWRPHSAAEVMEVRYGDCKDKANLLKSMLAVAGIDSHLAELYSHGGYPRTFRLPSLGNTNHAILAVDLPEGIVLADPTERVVPFGELPLRDQEADVFLIRASGARVLRSPGTQPSDNHKAVRLELDWRPGGPVGGTLEMELTGSFASAFRRGALGTSEKKTKALVGDWSRVKGYEVASVDIREELNSENPATVRVSGRLEITGAGERPVLRLSDLLHSPGASLPSGERSTPLVFSSREHRTLSVRLNLPGGTTVGALPPPVALETSFARYQMAWSHEGGVLAMESEYILGDRILSEERYPEAKAFFDAITAAAAQSVVLHHR